MADPEKRPIVVDADTDDIFSEEQAKHGDGKPWWHFNMHLDKPTLFGTWDGVFVTVTLNTFGIIVYLRSGWTVANAGIYEAALILLLSTLLVLLPVLSAIGLCERCRIQSGGVYFIVSHVLGAKIGTCVGLMYAWGQAIAGSLIAVGFGESMAVLLNTTNETVIKTIAVAITIVLVGINMAGVKWVVKVQLILFVLLTLSILDFAIGSFCTFRPDDGILGFSLKRFFKNAPSDYEKGENFFTVFGVYFATFTGVLSGVNMSGDLKEPSKNIPKGELSALGVNSLLCLLFLVSLGTKCTRSALHEDPMIAEKVSWLGVLFLCGLYVSSLSCILGSFYCAPRLLQSIAADGVVPSLNFLSQGHGPNKSPLYATIVVTIVTFLFIFAGELNTLAKMSTIPYLITYAFVNYSYVHLAMTYDIQQQNSLKEISTSKTETYGSMDNIKKEDLKQLFDAEGKEQPENIEKTERTEGGCSVDFIREKSRNWYTCIGNRWTSLIGFVVNLVLVFLINWLYALLHFVAIIPIYLYIGWANPALKEGISQFGIIHCIKTVTGALDKNNSMSKWGTSLMGNLAVKNPFKPKPEINTDTVNEENADFEHRNKYHASIARAID